jgi:hypothetical protein
MRPFVRCALRALFPALLLMGASACRTEAGPAASSGTVGLTGPGLWLWAWERPERLDFIDPAKVGVAYHAVTFQLTPGGDVVPQPRRQPLVVPPGTSMTAVMRIEVAYGTVLGEAQRSRLVRLVSERLQRHGARTVQIDFDARVSERPFYRELLHALRAALPAGTRLSMTALASWCLHDDWLDGLPVDEVVPMVFRMGVDRVAVRAELARRGDFLSPRCRQSVGFVTDEPVPALPAGRRVYWFSPRPWSVQDLERVLGEKKS